MIIKLAAGQSRVIPSKARYMVCYAANQPLQVLFPGYSLPPISMSRADILDLEGITEIELKNESSEAVVADLVSSPVRIFKNSNGSVEVSNNVVIDRILTAFPVEATATFNDENIVSAVEAQTAETNESGLAIVSEIQGQTTDLAGQAAAQTAALNAQLLADRNALIAKIDELIVGNTTLLAAQSLASSYAKSGALPLSSGVELEVLPFRETRKKAVIWVSDEVFVGGNSGIPANGVFTWECKDALLLKSTGGYRDYRVMEFFD